MARPRKNPPATGRAIDYQNGEPSISSPSVLFVPTLRYLGPDAVDEFAGHLLGLDKASRRDRFNGAVNDAWIVRYVQKSLAKGATIIGAFHMNALAGCGELHEDAERRGDGELAMSVVKRWQGHGIGGLLFGALLGEAMKLRMKRVHVMTHAQNKAMIALARNFGAEMDFRQAEGNGTIMIEGLRYPAIVMPSARI